MEYSDYYMVLFVENVQRFFRDLFSELLFMGFYTRLFLALSIFLVLTAAKYVIAFIIKKKQTKAGEILKTLVSLVYLIFVVSIPFVFFF